MAFTGDFADSLRCRSCGRALPGDARFCSGCGAALGADRAGERKPVTVLFVNAHGSLDLSAGLDPQEWHGVISRFLALLSDGVRRSGGVVDRFTGAGIKARFGAPLADEHHARRACEAALRLAREIEGFAAELRCASGIHFSARMGLHSGETLCAPLGGGGRDVYSAQGFTAALAARMEQLAGPGRIYLTEHTAALVRDFFRLRDLGPLRVRGLSGVVRVFELEGPGEHRNRLDAARARGLARFIGREAELARLEAALERAQRIGGLQVVGVVGEPGIGKSRLCEEFVERCRARGLPVYLEWGSENDSSLSLGASRRFLRQVLGVRDADPPQAARETVAGRLLLLDEGLRDSLPTLFDTLGIAEPEAPPVQVDFERRVEDLATIVKRLTEANDPRNPTVAVLDDRHFIDAATEALGNALFAKGLVTRSLMVMNYRPGYRAPWSDLVDFEEVELASLDRPATDTLLHDLIGRHPSLDGIAETIRVRSGGNPLFVEELIRALVEAGVLVGGPGDYRAGASAPAAVLPPTLRAVLAARIDRLGERDKRPLQAASVIGVRFRASVLRRVAGLGEAELAAVLESLAAAGLVEPESEATPGAHRFRHVLLRESAYESLVLGHRARLHAAVAGALAETAPGDDSQATLVAFHWEKAGRPLEAARWSRRAAQYAASRDPAEARRQWRKARELAARSAESAETLELRLAACLGEMQLGWHQGLEQREAAALLEEGRELAARCGDMRSLALLLATFSGILGMGNPAPAVPFGREACAIADRLGDDGLRLALRSRLALTLYEAGDLEAVFEVCDGSGLRAADPSLGASLLGFSPALHLATLRGVALADLGRLVEGMRALESTIAAARLSGDETALCLAITGLIAAARLVGEVTPGVVDLARESIGIAERSRSRFLRAVAVMSLANAQFFGSAPGEAAVTLEEARAIVRDGGLSFHVEEASLLGLLALASLARGKPERAVELAERTLAIVDGRGCKLKELDARLAWTRVAVEIGKGDLGRLERELAAAHSLIERTGARSREPLLHGLLAGVAQARGDRPGFHAESENMRRAARAIGATGHARKLAAWLAARQGALGPGIT